MPPSVSLQIAAQHSRAAFRAFDPESATLSTDALSALDESVLFIERVAPDALCLGGLVVRPVGDFVPLVLGMGAPREVARTVVEAVAVEVTDLLPRLLVREVGERDEVVDEFALRVATETDALVAALVDRG